VNGNFLQESYFRNRDAGYEPGTNWAAPGGISAIAIEPNTYGIFTAQGGILSYCDRRERMPGNLERTGIMVEPPYSLMVIYNPVVPSGAPLRHHPRDPNSGARSLDRYRFTVTYPDGSLYAILPTGALTRATATAGWRQGQIPEIQFGIGPAGSYLFTLETSDLSGTAQVDYFPFLADTLTPLQTFDLTARPCPISILGICKSQVRTNATRLHLLTRYTHPNYNSDPPASPVNFTVCMVGSQLNYLESRSRLVSSVPSS